MAKCIACGKPLSDPKSIEVGMGPVCRGKEAAAASEAPEDETNTMVLKAEQDEEKSEPEFTYEDDERKILRPV